MANFNIDFELEKERTGKCKGEEEEIITLGEWMKYVLVLFLPIINIILIVVWLFSKNTKKTLKNYIEAYLLFILLLLLYSFID